MALVTTITALAAIAISTAVAFATVTTAVAAFLREIFSVKTFGEFLLSS